jgi:hypothetical protein
MRPQSIQDIEADLIEDNALSEDKCYELLSYIDELESTIETTKSYKEIEKQLQENVRILQKIKINCDEEYWRTLEQEAGAGCTCSAKKDNKQIQDLIYYSERALRMA